MQRRAILFLEGEQGLQELFCILGNVRHHAENILRRVADADAACPKPKLIIRKIA